MKTPIVQEIESFFARYPNCSASKLARVAGVSQPVVSRALTGGRRDMMSESADKLRAAMRRLECELRPTATVETPNEQEEVLHVFRMRTRQTGPRRVMSR